MAGIIERYYVGQGKLFASRRSAAGQPLGFDWLGNVTDVSISTEETTLEHKESYSGQSLIDKVVGTQRTSSMRFTADWFVRQNFEKFYFGTSNAIAGATVTSETVIAAHDKWVPLARTNITTWTTLTNAAATTTYVLNTDYELDMKGGMIYVKSSGAIADAASLRANYQAGAMDKVSVFTQLTPDYYLRLVGLNQAEDLEPVIIDIYKFRPKPIANLSLIGTDFNSFEVEGMVLYDSLQPDNTADGRFFRIQMTQQT